MLATDPFLLLIAACLGCPYNRVCDGTNDAYCCDTDEECYHTPMGRAYCHTKTAATTAGGAGAGGAAAVTVTTGPPPPFGTYGGYTAAGRPITYPGCAKPSPWMHQSSHSSRSGQAGAWGGGAAGGVYPQVPTTPRRSEVPNGSGPGAGNSVPRNQPIGSGADLAIVSLDASPKPKAILAGRAGSITFTASGTSNTRIRKVIFYILGESLGPASGSGPTFSKRVDIGSLGLTANTLLRAVAYDANNIKLSYATMVIPVFVLPTWVTALWPIGGTATSYTNSYSYNFKLGEGEQEGIDDDFLPIKVTVRVSSVVCVCVCMCVWCHYVCVWCHTYCG